MKRIISGIKPTGVVTLGNYLGAMKRWAKASQDTSQETFFFVPDLHALTVRPDPAELRQRSRAAVAWLLAVGVRPSATTAVFRQSEVPAHAELAWILNNYATVGELNRMTQFKDKAAKQGPEGQLVGLYDYPVLMAADILLYDATEVPIGEDQKQHVELTRDIASRFNNLYGAIFTIPEPTIQAEGARIMDLQDSSRKMSKSDDSAGCIYLEDNDEVVRGKIMRAVTDSGSVVQAADDKPALTNLLVIFSLVSGRSIASLEADYAGRGYSEFKADLAEAVVGHLAPLRERYIVLIADDNPEIERTIEEGRAKASSLAEVKLQMVQRAIGLR